MYDEDDFGLNRHTWAEKSGAALRREEEAKAAFETARLNMEARDDLELRETVELLKPKCHLTGACWKTFRKHVMGFEGWTIKRRVATEEEKKKSGQKRKSAVYFIDVTYSVPSSKRSHVKRVVEEQDSDLSESEDFINSHVHKKFKGNY